MQCDASPLRRRGRPGHGDRLPGRRRVGEPWPTAAIPMENPHGEPLLPSPTAAVPVENNPCCSCRLRRVRSGYLQGTPCFIYGRDSDFFLFRDASYISFGEIEIEDTHEPGDEMAVGLAATAVVWTRAQLARSATAYSRNPCGVMAYSCNPCPCGESRLQLQADTCSAVALQHDGLVGPAAGRVGRPARERLHRPHRPVPPATAFVPPPLLTAPPAEASCHRGASAC